MTDTILGDNVLFSLCYICNKISVQIIQYITLISNLRNGKSIYNSRNSLPRYPGYNIFHFQYNKVSLNLEITQ